MQKIKWDERAKNENIEKCLCVNKKELYEWKMYEVKSVEMKWEWKIFNQERQNEMFHFLCYEVIRWCYERKNGMRTWNIGKCIFHIVILEIDKITWFFKNSIIKNEMMKMHAWSFIQFFFLIYLIFNCVQAHVSSHIQFRSSLIDWVLAP